jgi:hypothetical protein
MRKVVMHNEAHFPRRHLPLSTVLARLRHDGGGGQTAKAEQLRGR